MEVIIYLISYSQEKKILEYAHWTIHDHMYIFEYQYCTSLYNREHKHVCTVCRTKPHKSYSSMNTLILLCKKTYSFQILILMCTLSRSKILLPFRNPQGHACEIHFLSHKDYIGVIIGFSMLSIYRSWSNN